MTMFTRITRALFREPLAAAYLLLLATIWLFCGLLLTFGLEIGTWLLGDDTVAAGTAHLFMGLGIWLLGAALCWVAWKYYFRPKYAKDSPFRGPWGLRVLVWGWKLLCPLAAIGWSLVGCVRFLQLLAGVRTIHPVLNGVGLLVAVIGLLASAGAAYLMVREVAREWQEFQRLCQYFKGVQPEHIMRIAYTGEVGQTFRELLESPLEKAFYAFGLQVGEWLVLLAPLGKPMAGQPTSVDVRSITNEAERLLTTLQERFPGMPLRRILVHSHPTLRQEYVARELGAAVECLEDLVADGAYRGNLLGMIRKWVSPDDRQILRAHSDALGVIVWGINYNPSLHRQVRPDYDVVTFRVGSTEGEELILPMQELAATPLGCLLTTGLGQRLVQTLCVEAQAKRRWWKTCGGVDAEDGQDGEGGSRTLRQSLTR